MRHGKRTCLIVSVLAGTFFASAVCLQHSALTNPAAILADGTLPAPPPIPYRKTAQA
jgi:hypothetical protein